MTGYSANGNDPNGNIPFDFYTAKYAAANGLLLWERRGPYSPGPALATEARSIKRVAVDGDGNVVVTGVSFTNGWRGFYTAKYAAANGQPIWEKFYAGPGLGGPGGDWPLALAVDDAGNVIVTGASDCGCSNPDREEIYTVKYAAANGHVVWERRYDSGSGGDDRPVGVAVDRDGNVLLSGVTVNSCCVVVQPDYYTAKYAAGDGQVLWEQLNFVGVDGAVSRDFVVPQSIVVDSAGNAIVNERNAVANVTPGGTVNNLVKYAGADGHVLWEQLFEVGNCIGAAPSALAVDHADNVIVTGDAGNGNHQFLTAKFISFEVRATGILRPASGSPDGTPGFMQCTQTGVIGAAFRNNFNGRPYDAFPAEHINIQQAGK